MTLALSGGLWFLLLVLSLMLPFVNGVGVLCMSAVVSLHDFVAGRGGLFGLGR